jgi:hypothetical protein
MEHLEMDGFTAHLRNGIWITDPGVNNPPGALIGNDLLALYGAVLDCGEEILYLRQVQPSRAEQPPAGDVLKAPPEE